MIKSILVGLDGSLSSKSALSTACELAKITGAKVKGLYVENMLRLLEWQPIELMGAAVGVTSGIPHSRPTIEQVEIEKEFVKEGSNLKKHFDSTCNKAGIKASFFTKRGKIDEVIIEASKTVDLVIVGCRGKTYPESSNEPGPTTESLLRHTTRPVIVVPEGAKLSNHILIAYDGSKNAQRALFTGALFGKLLASRVVVVSVADTIDATDKPLNEAKEFLSAHELDALYVANIEVSRPWKAIVEQARNFKTGLIVLGAFGESKLLELIFGSTTREVLMQTTCPVLLCR